MHIFQLCWTTRRGRNGVHLPLVVLLLCCTVIALHIANAQTCAHMYTTHVCVRYMSQEMQEATTCSKSESRYAICICCVFGGRWKPLRNARGICEISWAFAARCWMLHCAWIVSAALVCVCVWCTCSCISTEQHMSWQFVVCPLSRSGGESLRGVECTTHYGIEKGFIAGHQKYTHRHTFTTYKA